MKIKFLFAALLGFCVLFQWSVNAQQPKQAEESNKAVCTVTILSAAQPLKVNVLGEMLYGRSGKAPEKQAWLQLRVKLTPPKAGHSVPVKELKVVDESSVYPAQAMARVEPDPTFSFFADATKPDFTGRTPAGFGLLDAKGEMTVMVLNGGGTSGMVMVMQKQEAVVVQLLFAVPATAKTLYFQIENGPRLPIRLAAE